MVRVALLRAAGTNCHRETELAFELAGAQVEMVHIGELMKRKSLSGYQITVLPGGFTYGDDLGAGRIFAVKLQQYLKDAFLEFIDNGGLVLGICNGFQILVKAGLLPDPHAKGSAATLTNNDNGRFIDRWVHLRVNPQSPCVFTKGIEQPLPVPIAHGEGKFVLRDDDARRALQANGQIALQYCGANGSDARGSENPNGSEMDIAGVCDPTGRILGLMPHPERAVFLLQYPDWRSNGTECDEGLGLAVFRNAVGHFG